MAMLPGLAVRLRRTGRGLGTGAVAARRTLAASPTAPLVVLGIGMALVAALVAPVNVRVSNYVLDETVIKQSAVHYSHHLPGSLFHDLTARATSRLYSLVLMPFFRLFDGDVAVRAARAFNGALVASTAVPVYMIARRAALSLWRAVASGLLSVALPWLALTSVLFTENLAYPLFWWALLAMVLAVCDPRPLRDAAAVVAIALCLVTRVQLAALLPAWFAALVVVELVQARVAGFGRWDGVTHVTRRFVRLFPFTLVALLVAAAVIAYLAHKGTLRTQLNDLLGQYSNEISRPNVPSDFLMALGVEIINLAIGVGVLPVIAAIAWYAAALRRGVGGPTWRFATVAVVVGVLFLAATVYAQFGYLGPQTEERYFFYVMPLAWIGALAAFEARRMSRQAMLIAGGALALLAATIPLLRAFDIESFVLAPVQAVAGHEIAVLVPKLPLSGFTQRDFLALAIAAVVVVGVSIWRYAPRARTLAFVAAPAALQLALTGYVFAGIDGRVNGVPGRTGGNVAAQGWIDHVASDRAVVTWINNEPRPADGSTNVRERQTLFYNDTIDANVTDPKVGLPLPIDPLDSLPFTQLVADDASGRLLNPVHVGDVVQSVDSPFLQLASERTLATSPDRALELDRPVEPLRLQWRATGLPLDGTLPGGKTVAVRAWPRASAARVVLNVIGTGGAPAAIAFELGGRTRTFTVQPNVAARLGATACVDAAGGASGGVRILAGTAMLLQASVTTAQTCR
jgi:hypothetical protein